jgi:hypothetical protein
VTTSSSTKDSYLKVRFSYGDGPTNVDYTNFNEDVGTYVALPSMEVTGIENTGGLNSKGIEIKVPAGISFFDNLADGRAFAPVYLYVTEVLNALAWSFYDQATTSEELEHAIGDYRLERVYKNPDREIGFVKLVFQQHKARSKIPLGIVCNPQCAWTLGDKSCQATVTTETGTISAIDGFKVTLTNPADAAVVTGQATGSSTYWHRGLMTVDGLSLPIRRWVDGSYDFYLGKQPPASWVGQVVTLRPGCAKTTSDCTTKFANIANFGGLGIKIPAYNPNTELS